MNIAARSFQAPAVHTSKSRSRSREGANAIAQEGVVDAAPVKSTFNYEAEVARLMGHVAAGATTTAVQPYSSPRNLPKTVSRAASNPLLKVRMNSLRLTKPETSPKDRQKRYDIESCEIASVSTHTDTEKGDSTVAASRRQDGSPNPKPVSASALAAEDKARQILSNKTSHK